jgi:AcrR family transcriptional regulator
MVRAASEVFIARGYRLTQMADVAKAIGVAKGTLYVYVESKEALFSLCVRHADSDEVVIQPDSLPVRTPARGELTSWVREAIRRAGDYSALRAALESDQAADPRAELETILRELYDVQEKHHRSIKLIDRAVDHPELGSFWQSTGRVALRKLLARYIESRIRAGQFRKAANVRLSARMVIEVIATWAMHIKWDHSPEDFDPAAARENAIAFLIRGLLPDS